MKQKLPQLGAIVFVLVSLCSFALGQQADRKIIHEAKPNYPEMAQRMKVTGRVTVKVSIARDGTVVSATALSGHPLLTVPAVAAAKECRYDSGEAETRVIEFNFHQQN